MRPLADIYRDLVAAGATPDVIALAIEAYESGGQSGKSGGKSGGFERPDADAYERRKAWDREYRAKRRAEKSGGNRVDESADPSPPSAPLVPPLSPAPLTPPIIPPPSSPPTLRGAGALKAEADLKRSQAKHWAEFQQAYPRRQGGQSWPAAEKKYVALVAGGVPEFDIVDGARRYADHLRKTGDYGSRFVKQALTWLNQMGWKDIYDNGVSNGETSIRPKENSIKGGLARVRAVIDAEVARRSPAGGDHGRPDPFLLPGLRESD